MVLRTIAETSVSREMSGRQYVGFESIPAVTGGERLSLRAQRSNLLGMGDCHVAPLLAMTSQTTALTAND